MTSIAPTVTVIIPTFNRADYLQEALMSVAAQTYPVHQVVVVDDCSDEPTIIPDVPGLPVQLLRHARNQGAGAARNTGMAHATGDWLVFLDDDDVLAPNRIQMAVEGMGDATFHACAVEYFLSSSTLLSPNKFSGDLRKVFLDGSDPNGRHPLLPQVVMRRSDAIQFNPTYRRAQDTDWWLRMTDRAVFAWSPQVGVRVRKHEGERVFLNPEYMLKTRRRLAVEHGPSSSRTRRAHLYRQVAGAALNAGSRAEAAVWSIKSLAVHVSWLGCKQLARAVFPAAGKRNAE